MATIHQRGSPLPEWLRTALRNRAAKVATYYEPPS